MVDDAGEADREGGAPMPIGFEWRQDARKDASHAGNATVQPHQEYGGEADEDAADCG